MSIKEKISNFITDFIDQIEKEKIIKLIKITALVVILEQVTKIVVVLNIPLYKEINIIPGFLNLTHVLNPGGAFGFLANNSQFIRSFVFLFVSGGAVFLIFYYYIIIPRKHSFFATGLALIFGGAIGNMIDRIRAGKVVDFLDVYIGGTSLPHWPAFNVADSAISIGVIIFVYHLIFNKIPE